MINFLFIIESPAIIFFVGAIIFLVFGASRLPQLAKSLGQTRKAFKDGMREAEEEERMEQEQKLLRPSVNSAPLTPGTTTVSPSISAIDDETLFEEARRRAAALKQQ
jgi:TatA/E family protein of Tat protein translocase